jgi:hypothetical protein
LTGRLHKRLLVKLKIALSTAAATGGMPGLPIPFGLWSESDHVDFHSGRGGMAAAVPHPTRRREGATSRGDASNPVSVLRYGEKGGPTANVVALPLRLDVTPRADAKTLPDIHLIWEP